MPRKKNRIIQVPVPEDLLRELDELSGKRDQSRSALIREACAEYIANLAEAEAVRRYIQSYDEMPETEEEREWAEMGERELARRLAEDEW
ncbi:MAG: ribbon-helix-helix protein, CopG family [Dehalococcoidia bacterium]|nr:ribbon-helix-helix protein, CopG family [Dehalococcoidia bacterium]